MFETKRCYINTFLRSDLTDVKKLYLNERVRRYLGGVREGNSITTVLDEMLKPSKDSWYWVAREKNTNEFIGLISLDPHHEGDDIEISYQFLPKWWGGGFATEVVRVIINFALTGLNLSKLVAETQTANTSSCKLLEKLGMHLEKTTTRFGAEQAIYSIQLD